MTEAVEKHQKELMEQTQKHQMELADALAARQQERGQRERLEKQLASQQQELAQCEIHEKDIVSSAQPQHDRKEVKNASTFLSNPPDATQAQVVKTVLDYNMDNWYLCQDCQLLSRRQI
jgi:hypothetical protein